MIGPTMLLAASEKGSVLSAARPPVARAIWLTKPFGMKRAVTRPQAMKAPRFGMIIPARNAPPRWMRARAPVPAATGV